MDAIQRKELAQQATLSAMDSIKTARQMNMIKTDEDLSKILCACFEVVMEETETIIRGEGDEKNEIIVKA